ncbi:hypothetical protein ACFQMM_23170 [Saliphagus sp. GCM10025308]
MGSIIWLEATTHEIDSDGYFEYTYMTTVKNVPDTVSEWFFFSGGPGAPRYGDDPTKHAVDHDTESFVREVIQNANDQRLDNDEPVEIRFRFLTLTGDEREGFLKRIGWETGLRDRLQTVSDRDTGRGYDRFLERLADSDAELRLLVIEDRNTTGLTGRWSEDSNYAALVRDELYSSKQGDTAGGSYGLGKSVLWTFSGASTVLFNSSPVTTPDEVVPPRFVGRTKLPTHELGDVTYQGAGWFCNPLETDEGIRPASIWGADAVNLANRLYLERPEGSGTSIMVVGYRDPTRDTRPEIEDLADEFVEAAVKYFWPAMQRGDLRVTIETPEDEFEASVENVPAIQPFVECFEQRNEGQGTLDQPGDVAGVDVPMNLPAEQTRPRLRTGVSDSQPVSPHLPTTAPISTKSLSFGEREWSSNITTKAVLHSEIETSTPYSRVVRHDTTVYRREQTRRSTVSSATQNHPNTTSGSPPKTYAKSTGEGSEQHWTTCSVRSVMGFDT